MSSDPQVELLEQLLAATPILLTPDPDDPLHVAHLDLRDDTFTDPADLPLATPGDPIVITGHPPPDEPLCGAAATVAAIVGLAVGAAAGTWWRWRR